MFGAFHHIASIQQAHRPHASRQPVLSAQPFVEVKVLQTTPSMPMPTDHHQYTIFFNQGPETSHNGIEEAIELQDTPGVFVATGISGITRVTISPEVMLYMIQCIQL